MPKKYVFLCCERAGTDITQKDEKQAKTRQNEHESGTYADIVRISPSSLRSCQLWSFEEYF
jgi:hypothetical protein